ncbi:cuticle protein 14 isoform b [Nephila pilipes]|uniref:Cuticle protein 14 isoform b n=1 Tax=Nephila pilipes TaxID=299642 RepID=A0A8X6NCL0_NEPPI|nr:cuticle protein 14 isoform b [Nephila pilipes]
MVLSQGTAVYNYPYYVNTGTSSQYNSQDGVGNYQFGYDEAHSSGGTFRKETGDSWGNKYGSYGLRDADGRYRVVNYVADAAGFRASVKTNEPGVAPSDPASTTINKPEFIAPVSIASVKQPGHVAPVPVAAVKQPGLVAPAPITAVQQPVLYAPSVHHAASPEFPLLYQTYYAPGYYKGTPYTKRAYYPSKGSPYTKYGYYIYP